MTRITGFIQLARRLSFPLRASALLILLNLISVGFEGIGMGLLLPIFELLRNGHSAADANLTGWYWDLLREAAGFAGLKVTLALLLAASFGFLLLRQALSYISTMYDGVVKRRTANDLRRQAVRSFLRARTQVQDEIPVGAFVNELTVELNRAMASLFSIVRMAASVLQMAVYIGGLFVMSPSMTVLSIFVFGAMGFIARRLVATVKRTGAAISDANTELARFLMERLPLARLIRLSGMDTAESKAFSKISGRQAERDYRHKMVTTRITLLPEPIAIAFAYTTLYVGSRVFGLSLEVLGLFVIVLVRLLPIVKNVVNYHNSIVGRWPAVERIDMRLRQLEKAREERGGDRAFMRVDKEICYENVSFRYKNSRASALNQVTVSLAAHRMTALVGPSGAGKSTFVDLLPRLRDPTDGRILVDGIPLDEFSMESLRAGVAFVPQQPQMFNIPAIEHIRYGKEDATIDEVREAARLAGAIDFIEALPDGFDTLLGDGGKRLSGGQRQRLDIARALVRRAPILILDEPTSALDADAEAAFRDALRRLRHDTDLTIIVIAHRLSTIADADQIVVLRDGHVEAADAHKDLLRLGGWYARAFKSQVEAHDFSESGAA